MLRDLCRPPIPWSCRLLDDNGKNNKSPPLTCQIDLPPKRPNSTAPVCFALHCIILDFFLSRVLYTPSIPTLFKNYVPTGSPSHAIHILFGSSKSRFLLKGFITRRRMSYDQKNRIYQVKICFVKGTSALEHKDNVFVFIRYDNMEKSTNSGPFILINSNDGRNWILHI